MAELRIPIVVENKGKKALKDVDKSLKGLTGTFKKLAGAAGIGLSTAAVINFGKEAAKAFIEDEKSARRLAMSVKNLGLGFETPRIESYISELSRMSGITDDQLRPSMQKLLQTTGSVTKSQELLTQALDISRGSGVDYETVISDLTAAYLGQTKGLSKYSLGLTKAELKTMSFAEIQSKLTDQFKGANADYLTTYAGQMELLNTAAGEAKETIGKGLVTALSLLAGEGNTVEPLAESMSNFSVYTSNAIVGVGVLLDKLKKLPTVGGENSPLNKLGQLLNPTSTSLYSFKKLTDYLSKTGAEYQALTNQLTMGYIGSTPVGIYPSAAELAKQRQLEAERIKREKELAALQRKSAIEAKKKAALDKASKTLDLERINITAALKGKISETDKLSLQLQMALLDKNDQLATTLAAKLEAAVKANMELQKNLLATPEAPNPYRNWMPPSFGEPLPKGFTPPKYPEPSPNPQGPKKYVPPTVQDFPSDSFKQYGPQGGLGVGVIAGVNPQINVNVQVGAEDVAAIVTQTQTNDSLSGSFNQVNRYGSKGAASLL